MSSPIGVVSCPVCLLTMEHGRISQTPPLGMSVDCPRCGKFIVDSTALALIRMEWSTKQHLLSAGLRAAWDDRRVPIALNASNIDEIGQSVREPRTVMESLERLLLVLAAKTPQFGDLFEFDPEIDYPLVVSPNQRHTRSCMHGCRSLGWIETNPMLSVAGWKRVDELRAVAPDSRRVFVAMSFHRDLLDAWLKGIQPGIEATKYFKAVRVDREEHNDKIDDRILALIKGSGVVVADCTLQRQGVYFEAGYAMGLRIPVVWTCRENEINDVHFDTRQYNYIAWTDYADLAKRLMERLSALYVPRSAVQTR
jgi:nucleoside 2-deoxyribosyltransferase